jgi:glycerol uptake facilitator-like aquaporin
MYLVYTFGHISGGQVNCAVTLALVLSGHLGLVQGVANFAGQLAGSLLGAGMLYAVVPDASASSLGANSIAKGFTVGNVRHGVGTDNTLVYMKTHLYTTTGDDG